MVCNLSVLLSFNGEVLALGVHLYLDATYFLLIWNQLDFGSAYYTKHQAGK